MVEPSRTEAVVEFDYVAQESDELSLRKGDVITDIRTQPGGWWEGSLGGKRGMFPDNFVRVLSESDNIKDSSSNDVALRPASGRRCKVLFSYQPVNEDELQLQVNDVIDIIAEVEEGWWKGKLKDAVGVFPSNFVSEVVERPSEGNHAVATASNRKSRSSSRDEASESDGELSTSVSSPDSSQLLDKADQEPDAPLLPPKPVKELCRALFPYEAANEDELTLKEGDVITLISREVQDKGWWRGELRGRVGVFPDNFVEIVPQDEQPKKPERPPAKSHLATTNRTRDTITKPTAAPGSGKSDSGEVVLRKPCDLPPRPDDRMSIVPPIPGKKPSLPPPIKKPQRIGSVSGVFPLTKQHESAEQRLSEVVDGAGPSRASRGSYSLSRNNKEEVPEFDSVERNAMLIHPTAFRAKAPRRRLPTTIYNKETNSEVHDSLLTGVPGLPQEPSTGLMNGNAETGHHGLDNHHEENEEKEESGLRGRLWEKNKVPWVEELKLNQAKKSLPGPRSSLSPRSPTLQQSPVTSTRSPDQIEKKPTPPPKEKPQTEQVHNRLVSPQYVHTPSSGEISISASFETPAKQNLTGVTMRHHGTSRAQSMFSSDVSRPQTRPFSMSSTSGLSLDQPRITPSVKPTPPSQSANRSISPSIATQMLPNISPISSIPLLPNTSSKVDSHSPSSLSDYDVISPATTIPSPGPTITNKQFMELREKVTKLEQSMTQQREMFMQALKEMADKLNDEIARRHQLEHELDKLSTLMTQV